jgi:hypothetical protein
LPCFAEVAIHRRTLISYAILLLAILLFSAGLRAQNVCEIGNQILNSAQPSGIAPAEIIRQFVAKETAFSAARERYGYTLEVTVQTVTSFGQIDGEYHQISEFVLGRNGAHVEKVTFAPESTLRRISLSQDDLDDIRIPVAITSEELPFLSVEYAGQQHVDQLDTYVFKVSPSSSKTKKKLFAGRIWVDNQDLMIVKTCGKAQPDEIPRSAKKGPANISPIFVTYREEIGGKLWFPTYSKADEFLAFPKGEVHVREVVKYSSYKPLDSRN